jgi:hypothetical protein
MLIVIVDRMGFVTNGVSVMVAVIQIVISILATVESWQQD